MASDIFDELVDWWVENNPSGKRITFNESLCFALRELSIMHSGEKLISRRVETDWHQNSDQTFMTIGAVDLENSARTRTVLIAAHAIVTPPPLPLEERAESWLQMVGCMEKVGISVPKWYLVWKAAIFAYYPPFSLVEYFIKYDPTPDEAFEFAKSLTNIFKGLAQLSLQPLGLLQSLRTDSFSIFYCGMGFDVGGKTSKSEEHLLCEYESETLPHLPESIRNQYHDIQGKGHDATID